MYGKNKNDFYTVSVSEMPYKVLEGEICGQKGENKPSSIILEVRIIEDGKGGF